MLHVVTLSRETVQSSMRVETMKCAGKKLSVIQEFLSMQQKFLSQQLMFRTGDNVFWQPEMGCSADCGKSLCDAAWLCVGASFLFLQLIVRFPC